MAKGAQFDLSGFILQQDGTYKKKSTSVQPRDLEKKIKTSPAYEGFPASAFTGVKSEPDLIELYKKTGVILLKPVDTIERSLTLTLFGIPMPKQSVRAFVKDDSTLGHFQPSKYGERTKDYIRQIKEQLPEGFTMFEHECHITKMHFIFPPLKGFHKIKGRMDALRNGEIIYKNTKGDIDNYQKILFDSLNGLVLKDDSIIVSLDNVKKYYATGGCVIVEMRGI